MRADDEGLGELLRLIRRNGGRTQVQLATLAKVPLNDVKAVEGGRADSVLLGRVRRLFEAQGGRVRLVPWWNGAAADRLIDERHAALVERVVGLLRARGWDVAVEVSFSEFGERGSIDVLAWHFPTRTVVVCEIKSSIGSLEETNRVLDVKMRLAPKIAYQRLGWRPSVVARLLIVPGTHAVRRVIEAHAGTMGSIYPARSRAVRTWLRRPTGPMAGIWFVSDRRNASRVPG